MKEVDKIDRFSKLVLEAVESYPKIIRNVAYAVTALPATQVSVERLSFALRIIHSDLHASMKEDLLEAILFLKSKFILISVVSYLKLLLLELLQAMLLFAPLA